MKKRIISLLTFICVSTIILFSVQVQANNGAVFSDINNSDWFYENVTTMVNIGYLNGYDDGTFKPSGTVTKAEFVSIVCRISGITGISAKNSHWADGAVQSALAAGVFDWDEIPPTAQNYDEPIIRQLAVKIVMNAFLNDKRGDYNTVSSAIKDFDRLDGRYYDSMIAAYCNGVIYGDDNGNINPKSALTRAEACAIIMRAANMGGDIQPYTPVQTEIPQTVVKGGVSENGKLHVDGTQLMNEKNKPIILHGMSSHGLQWYGNFASEGAIRATADYGANLFRCAMYTEEGGYISNAALKNTLETAADNAIKEDMYVIIDWHILSDGDPMRNVDKSAEFFRDLSAKYKDNPAVIYEICNEPNGNITWSGNVKPYAERIIPIIRANTDAVILVGSPTWSQDLHEIAKNPLNEKNIMYTCHFYAGTHTDWLRQRIMECGLPIFVSEWGTSAADGNSGVYLSEAQKWIDFMNEHKISWANWSLCDKSESASALVQGANANDGIIESELTESGKFVFDNF